MFTEALSYPRRGDDWLKNIGIGGVLLFLGFLIVPAILLYGYVVRVLRSAATDGGDATPPTFDEWGELLVDGLKFFVVSIGYVIVPYVLFSVGLLMSFGSNGGSSLGSVLALIGAVVLIVASYVLPVALTNFAIHDSLGAAFDFGTVFGAAFTVRYFLSVVLAIIVGGILGLVAGLLSIVIVGLFLIFYLVVVVTYFYAAGCGPALTDGTELTEQPSTESVEY